MLRKQLNPFLTRWLCLLTLSVILPLPVSAQALIDAAQSGDVSTVERLLKAGTKPDLADSDGVTALMKASLNGHAEVATALLKAGAKPDLAISLVWRHSWTALMWASENGHAEVAAVLLKAGAKPDLATREHATGGSKALLLKAGVKPIRSKSDDGWTALMLASKNGHAEVVAALLKAGANPDLGDSDGVTALMKASENGHAEVVALQLKTGANPDLADSDGITALMLASAKGHAGIAAALLKAGAKPNLETNAGFTSLMQASFNGHSKVVAELLKAGAKPDLATSIGFASLIMIKSTEDILRIFRAEENPKLAGGWTALMLASLQGHAEIVEALLKTGAKPGISNKQGKTALNYAKTSEITHLLINWPNINQQTVPFWTTSTSDKRVSSDEDHGLSERELIDAAQSGDLSVVEKLLKAGAKPDRTDIWGKTALIEASSNGYVEIVAALLKAGANPDLADGDGWTPLTRASQNGHAEVVAKLLKAGAQPDRRMSIWGDTSLIAASENGHTEVVATLLKARVKPDLANKNGFTALMKASRNGHAEVVALLLKTGAKPEISNKHGKTALNYAKTQRIVDLLRTSPSADRQKIAVAPVSALGSLTDTQSALLENMLRSELSSHYTLVPEKQFLEAQEQAFQELEVSQCTAEQCIRKIQELLQVERLFVLQVIEEKNVFQLSLTLADLEQQRNVSHLCEACTLEQLQSQIARMVSQIR